MGWAPELLAGHLSVAQVQPLDVASPQAGSCLLGARCLLEARSHLLHEGPLPVRQPQDLQAGEEQPLISLLYSGVRVSVPRGAPGGVKRGGTWHAVKAFR